VLLQASRYSMYKQLIDLTQTINIYIWHTLPEEHSTLAITPSLRNVYICPTLSHAELTLKIISKLVDTCWMHWYNTYPTLGADCRHVEPIHLNSTFDWHLGSELNPRCMTLRWLLFHSKINFYEKPKRRGISFTVFVIGGSYG